MSDLLWNEDLEIKVLNIEKAKNKANYGRLYTLWTALDAKFLPQGWKVPSSVEFNDLISDVGGVLTGGDLLKEAGQEHWAVGNTGTGARPLKLRGGGFRLFLNGTFFSLNVKAELWQDDRNAIRLDSSNSIILIELSNFGDGRSVIAVYDGVGVPPLTITDYDSNVYDVVKSGTYYWLLQPWACTHLTDGTQINEVSDATEWTNLNSLDLAYCNYNNDNLTLPIEGFEPQHLTGDLATGVNTLSQAEDIITANKGNFFWNPTLGYGINKKTNSNNDPLQDRGELIIELKKEDIKYSDLEIDEKVINLTLE